MVKPLTDDHVRALRLRAQRLARQSTDVTATVAQIVAETCGIQAQESAAAALAIRARSRGLLAADVERARAQERSIIRTWGPRGTLHLLATEDLHWLLPLLGPIFVAGDRRRREELGLDEETCTRGMRLIRQILANQGPLTRAELVEQLAHHGLRLEGQARPHFLARAALEGCICLGPDRDTEPTYVLLDEWTGQDLQTSPFSEARACAELTRRYLAAYGPATPQDQAAWSGTPLSQIRQAWHTLSDQLIEVEIAGAAAWMLKDHVAWLDEQDFSIPAVRLLPRFDTYLLGYHKRDLVVPEQYAKRINAGGGIVHPTILVNGRVVGTWKSTHKKNQEQVSIEPFDPLLVEVYPELEAEVADLARFLGLAHTWQALEPPQEEQAN